MASLNGGQTLVVHDYHIYDGKTALITTYKLSFNDKFFYRNLFRKSVFFFFGIFRFLECSK